MSRSKMIGKDYRHQITAVYVFKNGMVAVFDQHDKQMPFFQGRGNTRTMKRINDRIKRQRNKNVEWKWQNKDKMVDDF